MVAAVAVATLPWLIHGPKTRPPETLDILSFEVSHTMSRLVSLYNFLSETELAKLRNGPLRSEGIRYLNSDDEFHLLTLACCEKLDELDAAAVTVSRLGQRCADPALRRFNYAYEDLKQGILAAKDHKVEFYSKQGNGGKIFRKMEKYVAATTQLHEGLEALAEMEAAERKFQVFKMKLESSKLVTNNDGQRIAAQRKQVKRCRESSLWNVTFDKSVAVMTGAICVIYIRMCKLFGPFVSFLPCLAMGLKSKPKSAQVCQYASGPIQGPSRVLTPPPRFFSQELSSNTWCANSVEEETRQRVLTQIQSPQPSTVGGAGLALRFAEIIVLAERYLNFATCIDDGARSAMYERLPESLRAAVKRKLERQWNREESGGCQEALAEGWREAAGKILEWLAPVAHDTVKWQVDQQLERQAAADSDGRARGSVLLVQTLHYSDLEKTEAAIVEVLVALSCVYRYEDLRFRRD